jgi:chromosomal replication initiator protein
MRRGLSVDRVARTVARVLDLKLEDLRSARRSRNLSSARAIAGYLGRELGRISLSGMAEHFRRDRSTLVRDVQRLEQQLVQNRELRSTVAAITKRLPAL